MSGLCSFPLGEEHGFLSWTAAGNSAYPLGRWSSSINKAVLGWKDLTPNFNFVCTSSCNILDYCYCSVVECTRRVKGIIYQYWNLVVNWVGAYTIFLYHDATKSNSIPCWMLKSRKTGQVLCNWDTWSCQEYGNCSIVVSYQVNLPTSSSANFILHIKLNITIQLKFITFCNILKVYTWSRNS